MRLLALGLTGTRYTARLPFDVQRLVKASESYLHMETLIVQHSGTDGKTRREKSGISIIRIDSDGTIRKLSGKKNEYFPITTPRIQLVESDNLKRHFLLAYGPRFDCHHGSDDFEFNNPFMRVNRILSLFDAKARLTDPTAFLSNLALRARYKRFAPMNIMTRLCALGAERLDLDTSVWLDKDHDFDKEFNSLPVWKARMLLHLLDICRHMLEAFPKYAYPLNLPGVLLLHRPDLCCTKKNYWIWLKFVDALLPNFQIIISLPEYFKKSFPAILSDKRLEMPSTKSKVEKKARVSLPSGFILLVQVDGRLPNLALMKLSRYFKKNRKKVLLTRGDNFHRGADAVFASCIFNFELSLRRVARLKSHFKERLKVGGSGVEIALKLEKQIENLEPDYKLYPELDDRAIGFITRGCPNRCAFCIVPQKEGDVRQVCDFDGLLQGKRKKLILLDDNILSHPKADIFLEEMCTRDLHVNFTQTLDIRLINKHRARLLKRLKCENTRFTRSNYHFSLNNDKNFDLISAKYGLMGFRSRDNVEFVCMYGYNTTLAQDVRRFKFLRSLPGAYVFVQQYRPIQGGPQPETTFFFDDKADELIDELIGICFTQNMKSMEKYYLWVSRMYVETFGKLHMNLVNTIFRYNNRHKKGAYIASLAGTRTGN